MTLKHEVRTKNTIDTMNHLLDKGIKKLGIMIRHSDRFFSKVPGLEPFMGLTDGGKNFAFDFGRNLRPGLMPKLTSSFMGRCIETAYLIDKGYTEQNKKKLEHNIIDTMLSPFYVKDLDKVIPQIKKMGSDVFLQNWLDNYFDESIMENPEKTSDLLSKFMIDQIKNISENQVSICVSHDWNIYPLKEFKLGLPIATSGDVGYLDGVLFFEKDNQYYITSYQSDPVLL